MGEFTITSQELSMDGPLQNVQRFQFYAEFWQKETPHVYTSMEERQTQALDNTLSCSVISLERKKNHMGSKVNVSVPTTDFFFSEHAITGQSRRQPDQRLQYVYAVALLRPSLAVRPFWPKIV